MDKKGQGQVMELALTFFLVTGFALGMTVYVRRAIQARIHRATHYTMDSINEVYTDPSLNFVGNFYAQYEPYYQKSFAVRERDSETADRMRSTGQTGIVEKEIIREQARSETESIQAPPACAN